MDTYEKVIDLSLYQDCPFRYIRYNVSKDRIEFSNDGWYWTY